ncbi:MAG: phosphoribosyl-AMP cyclohydrolase [Deltaproteobacteria bacterium]|nr:MAG: phosphoribosyl-AMP cyclohydrolase [Deltaproteobacteria bacterium]
MENKKIYIDFEKQGGLVPVIAQDAYTKEVLMLAYMDKESFEKTMETGKATYFSRSRSKLWVKGETSGHEQIVKEIRIDCDNDTLLIFVEQLGGAACHKGYKSCFHTAVIENKIVITDTKVFDPEKVYGKKDG